MKISRARYDEETMELLAPLELHVKLVGQNLSNRPTFDRGFYHKFSFSAPTEAELDAKIARFFGETSQVEGYFTLTSSKRQYEMFPGQLYWAFEIMYAVEAAVPVHTEETFTKNPAADAPSPFLSVAERSRVFAEGRGEL